MTTKIKCKCGQVYIKPNIWPIKCTCSNTIYENGEYEVYSEDCIHKGEKIGLIDCHCQGTKDLYACSLHEICAIRKLNPGKPTIIIGDKRFKREVKYCSSCQDRRIN